MNRETNMQTDRHALRETDKRQKQGKNRVTSIKYKDTNKRETKSEKDIQQIHR